MLKKCKYCGDANLIRLRDSKNSQWTEKVYRCKACGHTTYQSKKDKKQ